MNASLSPATEEEPLREIRPSAVGREDVLAQDVEYLTKPGLPG